MSKQAFSPADLAKGAKSLHHTEVEQPKQSKAEREEYEESVKKLVKIYNKHDGDLDAIFEELEANPEKAKKPHNRPHSADEFAHKFLEGFYTLVKDEDDDYNADAKSYK